MADRIIATSGGSKPTHIYGLVDPITQQLRYIGKTVLKPERRLATHVWRAQTQPERRHSMAWIASLVRSGSLPEVITIEVVPAGSDWVEAEQFWIAYFRSIGADLCNHTSGGESVPGLIRSKESITKMMLSLPRGERHSRFGKPMPTQVKAALLAGAAEMRADPVRHGRATELRKKGMTPEKMASSVAGLKRAHAERGRQIQANATEGKRTQKFRDGVSARSKENWSVNRQTIIAAQNAGKGDAFRRANSERMKLAWADPNSALPAIMARRRKLINDDLKAIAARISGGASQAGLAAEYAVSQSGISKALRRL